jgi:hypothetical protein
MVIGLLGISIILYHFYVTPSFDFREIIRVAGLGMIVAGIATAMLGAAQMLTGGGRRSR